MRSVGEIVVLLSEKTEYYNDTGIGMIGNPSTSVKIGDKWYKGGYKIPVLLNKEYSLRVGIGGSDIQIVILLLANHHF